MAAWLREDGYTVDTAESGERGLVLARTNPYVICFVDLRMPHGMDGIETLHELRKIDAATAVIVITAYATVDTAIRAIREGAQEYIVKPCNPHELSLHVERLIRVHELQVENQILRERLQHQFRFHDIVSRSPRMHSIFELIRNVASLRSTVLVQGESGTGKEMIARALHAAGDRHDRPFVAVPCAALAESLLESELFGHEKGSFTGANERRKGKFELAHGGTLLLDEIGDISPRLQAELLRVLQERTFFRVGGSEEVKVDVRVVAATHRDLKAAVKAGTFREDLFYRLDVIHIELPPLRERMEDLPALVRHFIVRSAAEQGRSAPDVDEPALKRLMAHTWPGNVRELENAIERAMATTSGPTIGADAFQFLDPPRTAPADIPDDQPLREIERRAIEATLRRTAGNVKAAAASLQIDRSTLYDKMERYGLSRPSEGG
ncbi:MAG: sigma-54 dependent transcriptional regulator [Planctomycetes bacterium]|nr:sigma-54 dependent transcriptional regulator [Planctomycetota bacterium]